MSEKVKAGLKAARNHLRENQYIEAVKQCKEILLLDGTNYMALVMLAAGLKELADYKNQTPMALMKATTIQPNTPTAWQGIVAYYEKENLQSDNDIICLLSAYCKLLQIDR